MGAFGRYWAAGAMAVLAPLLHAPAATAVETDQFLVWDVELRDSAEPINDFINTEIEAFLDRRNSAIENSCDCPGLAEDIFMYFFSRRRTSRIKVFMRDSDDVEYYPDESISPYRYRRMSIYRDYTFPYIIPLSRTFRVGDVYFGIDKIGHMFGFGARYYKRYLRHMRYGATEQEAIERVVRWGILTENTVVGMYLDGVFAHADLEANYQGFRLARDLCEGDDHYLTKSHGHWSMARPIDMRDYITPDFDESYNISHWWADRKREVLPILRREYAEKLRSPMVRERFSIYRQHEPSLSKQIIERYYEDKDVQPQLDQSLIAFDTPTWTAGATGEGDSLPASE